jgi:hypothetical protein
MRPAPPAPVQGREAQSAVLKRDPFGSGRGIAHPPARRRMIPNGRLARSLKEDRMKTCSRILSILLMGGAASALGAGPYFLAFKFKAGDISRYRNTVTMELRGTAVPQGRVEIQEEFIETAKVLSAQADGSAEVMTTVSSFVQKANGEKTPATGSILTEIPQDTPILHTITKSGMILKSKPGKDLTLADKVKVEAALRNMKDRGIKLPAKALQMGESWKNEETLSTKLQGLGVMDTRLTMQYTLAAEEAVLGLRCVRILVEGSGVGTLPEGKGDNRIKFNGTLWFAPEKGDLIKVVMQDTEKLKVVGPNGPVEMSTTAVITTELMR